MDKLRYRYEKDKGIFGGDKMKYINKIKKEIEASGLRVTIANDGLYVYPNLEDDRQIIWNSEFKIIRSLIQKYNLLSRINFEEGRIRLH